MGYRIEGNRIFSDEEWREVLEKRAADAAADTRLFLKIVRAFLHYCLLSVIVYVQFLHLSFQDESEILIAFFSMIKNANKYAITILVISAIHLFLNKWLTRVINVLFIVYIIFVIYPILQNTGFVSIFA